MVHFLKKKPHGLLSKLHIECKKYVLVVDVPVLKGAFTQSVLCGVICHRLCHLKSKKCFFQ